MSGSSSDSDNDQPRPLDERTAQERLHAVGDNAEGATPLPEDEEDLSCCAQLFVPPVKGMEALKNTAFFILPAMWTPRVLVFNLIKTKGFEGMVIGLILANCVFLALDDPRKNPPSWQFPIEMFFTVAFTLEMLFKWFALGLVLHKGSYLRNSWNMLDFVIVVLSWLGFHPAFGNYTAFRTLRVLRPLRSMNAVKGLQALVIGLIESLKGLVHVMILMFFVLFIFAILGVQLFGGSFRYRCVMTDEFGNVTIADRTFCKPGTTDDYWGYSCDEAAGWTCQDITPLTAVPNPRYGYYHFDNVLNALLVCFSVCTFEDWTTALNITISSYGAIAFLYYFVMLVMGAYFVPNLVLAVINDEFVNATATLNEEEKKRIEAEAREEARNEMKRMQTRRVMSAGGAGVGGSPTLGLPVIGLPAIDAPSGDGGNHVSDGESGTVTGSRRPSNSVLGEEVDSGTHSRRSSMRGSSEGGENPLLTVGPAVDPDDPNAFIGLGGGIIVASFDVDHLEQTVETRDEPEKAVPNVCQDYVWYFWNRARDIVHRITEGFHRDGSPFPPPPKVIVIDDIEYEVEIDFDGKPLLTLPSTIFEKHFAGFGPESDTPDADEKPGEEGDTKPAEGEGEGQGGPSGDGDGEGNEDGPKEVILPDDGEPPTTNFVKFIVICILLNTVLLASYHYNQPPWLENLQDVANKVLTGVFTMEFVLRLFGMGPWKYCQDGFNVLDGLVVVLSLVEMGLSGSNTVSVFRALRLLRILKLLRQFPSLRQIIAVTIHAVKDTSYLLLIIGLYLFIVALVGVAFFGGKMTEIQEETGNRPNFDGFVLSLYTVFQILTFDGWVTVMFEAMVSTTDFACFYFIGQILIGNYVLLSLFLSILLSSFDTLEAEQDKSIENENLLRMKLFDTEQAKKIFGRQAVVSEDALYDVPLLTAQEAIVLSPPMQREFNRSQHFFKKVGEEGNLGALDKKKLEMELKERAKREREAKEEADRVLCVALLEERAAETTVDPRSVRYENAAGLRHKSVLREVELEERRRAEEEAADEKRAQGGVVTLGTEKKEEKEKKEEEKEEPKLCPNCGTIMELPLPSAPLVMPPKIPALHKVHCKAIGVRVAKQVVLDALMDVCNMYIAEGQPAKLKYVEMVMGQAWTAGMLLNETMETFVTNDLLGWRMIMEELKEMQLILDLRVNEEQLGRSLIAFALANVPKDHQTNGGDALFIFGPRNPFRIAMSIAVQNPWFDRVVLLVIFANAVTMAMSNPRDDPESDMVKTLETLGYVWTGIFTCEMLCKWVAYGLILHEGAYLRDAWNCLDCFIVMVSLLSLALTSLDLGFLGVFRALRALRPLRVINRNRGLKMVVRTLLASVPGIVNVGLICSINYIIFGILGVQFFGGKFQSCNDFSVNAKDECNGTYFDDIANDTISREWRSEQRNFDNIGTSVLTLFEVSSGEWWGPVLYRAMDACSEVIGPQRDCNVIAGMFFIVFFSITGFFLINLFVGVVIHNFKQVKEQMDGSSFMTPEQKLWVAAQQLMLNFRPAVAMLPVKNSPVSHFFAKVCERPLFDVVVGVVIMMNVVVIAMDHYGQSKTWDDVLGSFDYFFVTFFLVEASLKLLAYRLRYFRSGWNQFDFFLVVLSMLGLILNNLGQSIGINVGILRVFRIFRILRILRLVKQAKKIRILLETLWYSLPSMANISLFILLVDFIYGVLGVDMFALLHIPKNANSLDDRMINFKSIDRTVMLLFRYQTLEEWNGAMHDCMIQPPYCSGEECGTPWAPLYFVTFIILTAFVITNLLIAIILDNFDVTMKLDNSSLKMNDLNRFVDIWSELDDDASMTIRTDQFAFLLAKLQAPLGVSRVQSRKELLSRTAKYRIPEHGGYIHFVETLIPLARTVKEEDPQDEKLVLTDREVREHETLWRLSYPNLAELPVLRYRQHTVTVDQYYCSTYIAGAYRAKVAQRIADKLRYQKLDTIANHCEEHGIEFDSVPYLRKHMDRYRAEIDAMEKKQDMLARRKKVSDPVEPKYGTMVMTGDFLGRRGPMKFGNDIKQLPTLLTRALAAQTEKRRMRLVMVMSRQDAQNPTVGPSTISPHVFGSRSPPLGPSPATSTYEGIPTLKEEPSESRPNSPAVIGPSRSRGSKPRYPSAIVAREREEQERRDRIIPLKISTNRKRILDLAPPETESMVPEERPAGPAAALPAVQDKPKSFRRGPF